MTVLALDLGKNIGWVKGGAVGPVQSGTFPLEDTTDLGEWLRSADPFLTSGVLRGVSSIAIEQPFMGKSLWPMQKLSALLGHIVYYASFEGVGWKQVEMVGVSTGKKKLAGSGRAEKEDMIAAAIAWGLDDPDEHEADALGIFLVHLFGPNNAPPPRRTRSGPVKVIKP